MATALNNRGAVSLLDKKYKAAVNDFNYTTAERDFRETSLTAGLNIQY